MRRWPAIITIIVSCFSANQTNAEFDTLQVPHAQNVLEGYSWWNGFEAGSIDLNKDGTFEFNYRMCTGSTKASGRYFLSTNSIQFHIADSDSEKKVESWSIFAEKMHRIRWGEREYLVPEKRMIDFVSAINLGIEMKSYSSGYYYLRDGDEVKRIKGNPEIPLEWQSYLLPKPLFGVVRRVEQSETRTQKAIVIINAGSRKGLKKGMLLFAYNPRRPKFKADLEIIEIFEDSARVIVPYQLDDIRRMDIWSTRTEKKLSPAD